MLDNTKLIPVAIEDEVKESYLNYAMSVIVSRALPDVRDGLKPVHRRILYAMNELGVHHNQAYKKSMRIVGDVLGKYHPHGDAAVYDSLVRLAQDFSLRNPLVQGQGNFGSIDGDPPAAPRYTEARMSRICEEMLRDMNKETVDYAPNYDESLKEPTVLPAALPNLLLNGTSGIAVGMATNMPPYNLREVCSAVEALIDNPDITIDEIIDFHIQGPDFPTAAQICGRTGFRLAAHTGKGRIMVRSKYDIEEMRGDREAIIFTEIPYMVNKANLIIKIADLVKDKRIEGIADIRDESDRDGMRIVIILKRGIPSKVVVNQLFAHTQLQNSFNVNALALVEGRPKLCNLKELLTYFIEHRVDVITRRTEFDLRKAKAREHILEGLMIALQNIDEVVEIIKRSENVDMARANLMQRFDLSEKQAQAILDMRLHRLTSLETKKLEEELTAIREQIAYLESLLADKGLILEVIKEETAEIAKKYGDERRTAISLEEIDSNVNIEDLIQEEDMTVMISSKGYVKRVPLSEYRLQSRGGKGSISTRLKDDDNLKYLFIGNTHTKVLFVTNKGKAYWLKVYELPEGSRYSKGKHIKSIVEFEQDEEITASVLIDDFKEDTFIFMATRNGKVKRVSTYDFRNAKKRGIRAIDLGEDDYLIEALLTDGERDVILISRTGKGLRYTETEVRAMGRTAGGVRGIRLQDHDSLIGVCPVTEEGNLVIISEKGLGKRTTFDSLTPHSRGTQGQRIYSVKERTGELVGALSASDEDSLICMTSSGKALKLKISDISLQGRNASGVRVVNVDDEDSICGIDRILNDDEEEETEETSEEKEVVQPELFAEETEKEEE